MKSITAEVLTMGENHNSNIEESKPKRKNIRKGKKSVQFWIQDQVKDLTGKIKKSDMIKFSGYEYYADFLRDAYKRFVYFLLIKTDQTESIPEFDRIKLERIYKLNSKHPFINNIENKQEILSSLLGI